MFGNPFLYLFGTSVILFGVFGITIVGLLRRVRREEHERETLEDRLSLDELRIRAYDAEMSSPQHFATQKTIPLQTPVKRKRKYTRRQSV